MTATKTCPSCRKRLSAAAFNDSGRSADGLARVCRSCTNARRRQLEHSRTKRRQPSTNFAAAVRQGDIKTVQKLLRAGATPDWGWVCEAMHRGHVALAEMLLESGAERNIFTMAAMADSAELTRRLRRTPGDARLTASMEPNSQNVTPLHVCCAADLKPDGLDRMTAQTEVAKALWGHGADLNATARYRGIDDATPTFCACWSSGNLALVRWLLDQGAIATDRDLLAALGHFQRHGRPAFETAEALLAWGLPVDGAPGDRTPLQAFAHHAAHKTVSWLMAHGADVNSRGPGGRTAAHLAAERNTGPTTLALLIESGADLAALDEDGHTPLDIAKLNGKVRLVEWMKRRARRQRSASD